MPAIPLHKNSPIAAKPDGIVPQTASSDQNPPPTRTTPPSIPATTTASSTSSGPPPPQPGARPAAPTGTSNSNNSDPPPPQPGYTATVHTTETRLAGPPAQYSIPPPTANYLPTSSTTPSTTASKPGPTTLNLGPAAPSPSQTEHTGGAQRTSLEHPPGYTQAPDHPSAGTSNDVGQDMRAGAGAGTGVGGAAWNMLNAAGEALKKGEEAAWRAVRGK